MPSNTLYDLSIPTISQLQQSLPNNSADFMQWVSVTFDPKYAFLIYAPIAFILNPLVGKRLILATVLAEWLNQILKWASFGERPYWYVHSSGRFDVDKYPIRQFPVTCETGPGAPSGHSQLTAAVWLVILESINDLIRDYLNNALLKKPEQHLKHLKALSYVIYVSLISLVALSRVYLACHFPQQCVAGALLGYLIAKYVLTVDPKPAQLMFLSIGMLTSAFAVYFVMIFFGFDPSWTFALASKHCENPDNIHVDTTPFFSIMRYCGFALGAGLGLLLPRADIVASVVTRTATTSSSSSQVAFESESDICEIDDELDKTRNSFARISTRLAVALIAARLVDNLATFVSHSNLAVFYSSAFAVYTVFSFLIVSL